nr:reverse transcriptase domain-containing protein [Tanacetum cinerariifolium]
MPRECLAIIESKSKVCYSRNKPVVAKVSMNTSTSGISPDVAELKDMVKALLLDKKSQNQSPATMKAVKENCVTCGGAHSYRNCPATDGNVYHENIQEFVSQAFAVNYNQGNTRYPYQAPAYQAPTTQTQGVSKEDFSAYVKANDAVMRNMKTQGQNMQNQLTNLIELITKFVNSNSASTLSSGTLPRNTIANSRSDLKAITTRRDPGKFLIPCDFLGMAECLALADLGAIINLMPFSVWKRLSLSDLTPTCMNLELADCLISRPVGVAEDVYVKVGSFHFSADFVVVDFNADPRVPLILVRSFLKTERALIDVFECELTLRVGKEAITFNIDQTSRYSANYSDMTAKRIDVIGMACEEYSDFLLEEVDAFLAIEDDPTSPEVELKDLPPHLEYAFLEGDDELSVIIAKDLSAEEKTALITVFKSHKRAIAWKLSDIKDQEKTAFTCPYGTFAYRRMPFGLCNAPGTFQRCMMAIFHDMIEKTMEVFMDDILVFENSFQSCLSHLERILKRGNKYILVAVDHLSKWVEAKALPTNDARVVCKFLKNIFARFGTPRAIISDRGTHFSYKAPIGCTPYKLVYGKACHLHIELEHKAYWALKHAKFDLKTKRGHRKVQLNELNELRDQAYRNSLIYKEKTKRLHDSKIKERVFNIGDRVLLFNSRLKIFFGKLKSCWSGPFTISQDYPYGTLELS